MESTTDDFVALILHSAGKDEAPEILKTLRDGNISDLCYAYKIRIKPAEKLVEKKERKLKEKKGYQITSITDVVGLRLVTLFKGEMINLLDKVLAIITNKVDISPNPFVEKSPEEIIVFFNENTAADYIGPSLREVIEKYCPDVVHQEKRSNERYSSIHLVTRLRKKIQSNGGKNIIPGDYLLPIEIQIRTVFEDAWGEIDHKFGYAIRAGKDQGGLIKNADHVMEHLKVLKQFSDACMNYAERIRIEATGPETEKIVKSKVFSVQADEEIINEFRLGGASEDLIRRYLAARSSKDNADKIFDINIGNGKEAYIAAADEFRQISQSLEENGRRFTELNEGEKLLNYYSRMNEAISLMKVNDREHVTSALSIYRTLDVNYSEYALLKMRYGQAFGRLGYLENGVTWLREAGRLADAKSSGVADKNNSKSWPKEMPKVDYEYLAKVQPKLVGFYLWKILSQLPDSEVDRKAELYRQAYTETEKAIPHLLNSGKDSIDESYHIYNNLLYYAVGYIQNGSKLKDSKFEQALISKIPEFFSVLKQTVHDFKEHDLQTLDTLMRAYAYANDYDSATACAALVKERSLEAVSEDISAEDRLDFIRVAEGILSKHIVGVDRMAGVLSGSSKEVKR